MRRQDSPQYALDRLDPRRIVFARELRGMTKKQLAETIRKTSSAISRIERGMIRPDLETFVTLSFALRVPASFFIQKEHTALPIDLDSCHFRSLRSLSQTLRRQSARKGDLFMDFAELLASRNIVFPQEQISDFSASAASDPDIEEAAADLRRHWKMGLGPIPNLVQMLESKGIMVLPLPDACHQVDAYSTWRGKRPCIFLSFQKSASRVRFDISHELGHLVLHEDISTGDAKTERQASRFAGAFLAPAEAFCEECPRKWNLEAFRELKLRWKMSVAALLFRAKDLGCISVSAFQRAMIQLGKNNMRKNEGEEWPAEQPVLIAQALDLLKDTVTLEELAGELSVYPGELRQMLALCVPADLLEKIDRKNESAADSAKILRLWQN